MESGNVAISKDSSIEVLYDDLNQILGNSFEKIQNELSNLRTEEDISEIEMMMLNVAVSRFNTIITLASGIYKNLCDGEKAIAQKM